MANIIGFRMEIGIKFLNTSPRQVCLLYVSREICMLICIVMLLSARILMYACSGVTKKESTNVCQPILAWTHVEKCNIIEKE